MSATTSLRIPAGRALVQVPDRVLGGVFCLTGAFLVYLVLFDQGAALTLVLGTTAGRENLLHEFFHDGRHFWNAPCH